MPPKQRWRAYTPLIVIVVVTVVASLALQERGIAFSLADWMRDWMGLFLVVFAMLKLFDLRGFADGFQRYDLLASRSRTYACMYPFLELGIGIALLAGWQLPVVYGFGAVLFTVSAIGVIIALRSGLRTNCACLGSGLNVPLSGVALVEDLGMAAMCVAMLVV